MTNNTQTMAIPCEKKEAKTTKKTKGHLWETYGRHRRICGTLKKTNYAGWYVWPFKGVNRGLTGLFATSGYSGKASWRCFVPF